MQLVVLAGGKGTRLGAAAGGRPKPLADIGGMPFLTLALTSFFESNCITSALFLIGQDPALFEHFLHGECAIPVPHTFKTESHEMGTGGALLAAMDMLEEDFLVMNGDTYFPIDPKQLIEHHPEMAVVMALARVSDTARYGAVSLTSDGNVASFQEKGITGPGLINGGVYRITKGTLLEYKHDRHIPVSLERDILPRLIAQGLVAGLECQRPFLDIGVPADLERARQLLSQTDIGPKSQKTAPTEFNKGIR